MPLTEVQQTVIDAVMKYDGIARYATLAYKLNMRIFEVRAVLEAVQLQADRAIDIEFGQSCVFVRKRAA